MYKTPYEATSAAKSLRVKLVNIEHVDVVVCPPAVDIVPVRDILKESIVRLGGQNMHWADEGAFTGEISASMLKDAGCEYVILGHSERRHVFGEADADINRKVLAALASGLKPIFCVGETLEERNSGSTNAVVERQLRSGLAEVELASARDLIVAYEPVWAIGTGVNAPTQQAEEVHEFIRSVLSEMFGESSATEICIQYGGSVKPGNAAQLLSQPNIDGALIGGASLSPDSFSEIIKTAETI